MLLHRELSYRPDSAATFDTIADRPWSIFLDSGEHDCGEGRYDVLTCDPLVTLVTQMGETTISGEGDGTHVSRAEPLHLLRESLQALGCDETGGGPFAGGAFGYFAYDLMRSEFGLSERRDGEPHLPDMAVGIYGWAMVTDHQQQRSWIGGRGEIPEITAQWQSICAIFDDDPVSSPMSEPQQQGGPIDSNMDRASYRQAVERIHQYLRSGDCYQVNLAQRFTSTLRTDPWTSYRRLREISPAPFGAYLNTPFGQLLCNSPELFLRLSGDRVATAPIKGTRPRGQDPDSDRANAEELAASAKDRAENVMIVDLLRNDLGRVCRPGSIRVEELFSVASYAKVHHLVSRISGVLQAGHDAIDLLHATFPGGSITGAPKRRAMTIIDELEPHRRGLYCGSIGHIGFDGDMVTNIAIRTMVVQSPRLYYWAGGGIVIDSHWESEYQESLDKAAALFQLLGE